MSGRDAPAEEPRSRVPIARWAADLAMGGRFAVTGGRESWARTIMTAVGVGLGVALLLLASSVPTMYQQRHERGDARSAFSFGVGVKPGPDTLRVTNGGTTYRDQDIGGILMAPDGKGNAPRPPGIDRVPAAGEMWVSPALKDLLASDEGKLLRDRFPYRTIGVIGDSGLAGPAELTYYAGISQKAFGHVDSGYHIDHWGADDKGKGEPLDPALLLLIIVGCVVLLLPVLIFIATAARFGGERRDRRLAALRLVGADIHMTRRIAAGESLFGALFGLAVGGGLFLLGRELVSGVDVWGISFFASDIVPSAPLALAIAAAVPASAVMVTLIALRGIAIEPLGVVRNAKPKRRRLWWRLLLPLLGMAMLLPLAGGFGAGSAGGDMKAYQAAAGAVLVLVGVTALLPWVVEAVVERFGGRGSVPWQLATRRLQLSSGTASRAVSGITVAVAGALALQMLFASVQADNTESTGQDPNRAQLMANVPVANGAEARDAFARYRATKGVRDLLGVTDDYVSDVRPSKEDPSSVPEEALTVADCPSLREVIRLTSCENGDVFLVDSHSYYGEGEGFAKPGAQVNLAYDDGGAPDLREKKLWTIPRSATQVKPRQDPTGGTRTGIFATPAAFDVADLPDPQAVAMIRLDQKVPDATEYVRNTSAALSPAMDVMRLSSTSQSDEFSAIRKALFIGATATLLLIGASMIVTTLEQLRERKRLLSVLVAFGTRRTTLSWSVLWQTAVPVVLGLALSIVGGLALGVMLLKMVGQPLAVDWSGLGTMTGIGGGVILLVTLVSLPPLWRMMRPEGLRTE
ncbi:ABC transporter permease [Streptomyces malaysiensis subsp. malaysiensis]|uniref:ABC transporter permease n=1 Tax=Streptomyces TaxID=1883 RepID=UPI001E3E6C06|nr:MULTISPECIES: FtsX-like permease family protein [unclassified Streptomyces]MCD9594734.1 ABC transporter permease [Streptomyces sp. 8ZJF_21]WHX18875.1 ABC transporter permease [Streptomyces sp. NA07423]